MKNPAKTPKKATRAVPAVPLQASPPAVQSEGQRLLLASPQSLSEIGELIGASRTTVARYRHGELRPAPALRVVLETALGIPAAAWDVLPGHSPAMPSSATQAPVPALDGLPDATTMDEVLALLALIRSERDKPGKLAADVERLIAAETRALSLKHRLERDQELLEDRIVRDHPAWARLRKALIHALAPHPKALAAVAEALQGLDL